MTARAPDVVIHEAASHLAFLATESMYADQPDLWDLGEKGRQHTLNDFTLHFQAVAAGDDVWSYMRAVGRAHLDQPAQEVFLDRLGRVVGGTDDE